MNAPIPFDQLTEAQQQEALRLAQRRRAAAPLTSPQNLALQGSVMGDPTASVQHVPGESWRAKMLAAQQNVANLPRRITEAAGATPGGWADLSGAAASGMLNVATSPFGTPEGLAISAALPLGGKVAQMLPRLPVPNLLRTGAMGAVGAGTAALTGGDPTGGLVEGLTAGAIGGLFKAISNRRLQHKEDTFNLTRDIAKEVPILQVLLPELPTDRGAGTIAPLLMLRDKGVGQALMSQHMQNMDLRITQAVGATPIKIPALDESAMTQLASRVAGTTSGRKIDGPTAQALFDAAQKAGLVVDQTMTIGKALREVKIKKALAANAPDGAIGFTARERARQVQEQIDGVVKEAGGEELLAEYRDLRTQYGKWMAIAGNPKKNLLQDSGVLELTRSGGKSNFGNMAEYIADNFDEYGPTKFPALSGTPLRGAPLGSTDTSIRIPTFGVYGRHLSEHGRSVDIPLLTGTTGVPNMGKPYAGLIPSELGVMGMEYALQPGAEAPLGQGAFVAPARAEPVEDTPPQADTRRAGSTATFPPLPSPSTETGHTVKWEPTGEYFRSDGTVWRRVPGPARPPADEDQ